MNIKNHTVLNVDVNGTEFDIYCYESGTIIIQGVDRFGNLLFNDLDHLKRFYQYAITQIEAEILRQNGVD